VTSGGLIAECLQIHSSHSWFNYRRGFPLKHRAALSSLQVPKKWRPPAGMAATNLRFRAP
jgi:hypothetical protein